MKSIRMAGLLTLAAVISAGTFGCSSGAKDQEVAKQELIAAEAKMFDGIMQRDPAYLKDLVTEDYWSINADGVMQNKAEMIGDSAKAKMFAGVTNKLYDKQIRVYDNLGIITGRARAYMGEAYLVEYLYTAVFVKKDGRWMFTGWQGTVSKDSPKPPPMPGS